MNDYTFQHIPNKFKLSDLSNDAKAANAELTKSCNSECEFRYLSDCIVYAVGASVNPPDFTSPLYKGLSLMRANEIVDTLNKNVRM